MNASSATVDYRLLQRRSTLLLCTACFRRGIATPIAQVVSARHRPKTICPSCEKARPATETLR